MSQDIRVKCATCGRVEKNGKWVDPKGINPEILKAIGIVICPDCQPKAKVDEFNERGIA